MILFLRVFAIWFQEQPSIYRLFLGCLFVISLYSVFYG